MAATSIFFMPIIASNARLASAPPAASASVSARGVICQESPQRSLHQPQSLSWPPLPTMAFQYRSVSSWESVVIWKEKASVCVNAGPPLRPRQGMPSTGELHRQDIARLAARVVAGSLVDRDDFTVREGGGVEARRVVCVLVEPEADRVLRCQGRELHVRSRPNAVLLRHGGRGSATQARSSPRLIMLRPATKLTWGRAGAATPGHTGVRFGRLSRYDSGATAPVLVPDRPGSTQPSEP